MAKASKKHHSSSSSRSNSKRKHRDSKSRSTTSRSNSSGHRHRERERSRHKDSDSLSTFAIQDHPSGVSLPYPEFDFPRPPPVPPLPIDGPRNPQPVVVRQHGLYVTPRQREPEQISHQKAWPGPAIPKPAVVNSDPEKGMYIDAEESKESPHPTKPQSRWRTRKSIFILLLVATLFLALPIAIGAGIIAKKRHNNSNSGNEDEVGFSSGELDNGLSYGDWYCAQCRCYSDEEALNKCLEHLNSGAMDSKER